MTYQENRSDSLRYKEEYLSGLEALLHARQKDAATQRKVRAAAILREPEKYRAELREMLGFPLNQEKPGTAPLVESELLSEEDGYNVYRLRIEILENLTMTGIYFCRHGDEKKPLVIVQHGGAGTPELISGFFGSTSNYNDMLMRVFEQDVHVFAPQLLLWDVAKYGASYDRPMMDARLKRVGSSITAIEVFGMMRALDYFETVPNVSCFGMVGLSYGGFYTQMMAALDTRIESAISCSYFNERDRHPRPDWTWNGSAHLFDDAELALLVYPRKLCLAVGEKDNLFACEGAKAAFSTLQEACNAIDTEWVDFFTFDGVHEFFFDDEAIKKLALELKRHTRG